jgi:hypothetical protein
MRTPNTIETEIDRIRLEIYEETKHLTSAQRAEHTNKIAEAVAERYGFKISPGVKKKQDEDACSRDCSS